MDNIDLQKYIQQSGISAEILTMNGDVHSVLAASKELGTPPSSFIKTIVFVSSECGVILAIVKGTDRASSKRIGKILGIESPKLGTTEEALKLTGYEVGGTPPVSIQNTQVLIDPKVMEMEKVVGGGGTRRHLLQISPKDIVQATGAKILRIRK